VTRSFLKIADHSRLQRRWQGGWKEYIEKLDLLEQKFLSTKEKAWRGGWLGDFKELAPEKGPYRAGDMQREKRVLRKAFGVIERWD